MKKLTLLVMILVCVSSISVRSIWASDGPTMDKLNTILENQTEILKELSEIKEELQIVKIRASQR